MENTLVQASVSLRQGMLPLSKQYRYLQPNQQQNKCK